MIKSFLISIALKHHINQRSKDCKGTYQAAGTKDHNTVICG